jgi:hypothetical protein
MFHYPVRCTQMLGSVSKGMYVTEMSGPWNENEFVSFVNSMSIFRFRGKVFDWQLCILKRVPAWVTLIDSCIQFMFDWQHVNEKLHSRPLDGNTWPISSTLYEYWKTIIELNILNEKLFWQSLINLLVKKAEHLFVIMSQYASHNSKCVVKLNLRKFNLFGGFWTCKLYLA